MKDKVPRMVLSIAQVVFVTSPKGFKQASTSKFDGLYVELWVG
jgi:hypothetical protein